MKAMKAGLSKLAMKAMKAMKATPTKKKVGSGTTSDSLWDADPALAASLALVPLGAPERQKMAEGSSGIPDDCHEIPRRLPPALVELKESGTWNKDTMTAVPNYLQSLQKRFGMDVQHIIDEYKAGKHDKKKAIARSLALAKTNSDLKAVETTYCGDRVVKGTLTGWASAFEVWDLEKIPMVESTQAVRVATLAVLERKPHPNPLRARLGEFVFQVSKEMLQKNESIREQGAEVKNTAKLKDEKDYDAARGNMKRAALQAGLGVSPEAAAPKKKPKVSKPIDLTKMSKAEKEAHEAKQVRIKWIRDANTQLGRLNSHEALLNQAQNQFKGVDIPKKINQSVGQLVGKIQNMKNKLNAKLADLAVPDATFGKKEYTVLMKDIEAMTESFNKPDATLKKARQAIDLAK